MKPKFCSRRIEMNSKKAKNIRESNDRKTINPVKVFHLLRGIGAVLVLLALAACGSSVPPPVTNSIGPNGGTVTGPGGTKVVIPEGALTQNTEIAITQTSDGAPALPPNATSAGAMFALTPHGTTFAVPVTITVPFDASAVSSGATPKLLKTNATQSAFDEVAGATVNGNTMTAQITSFSFVQVVSDETPPPDSNPFLDPTFGGGKVTTAFSAFNALALQADGKTVMVGGSFQLARYDTNGVLDESFGEGGLVITDSNARLSLANAVVIQPDGKIIVVGETGDDFGLARYDSSGNLDGSFGEDGSGIVTTDFGSDRDRAFAVALQTDDDKIIKIIVVGDMLQSTPSGSRADFSVARYNADGTLDTSFNGDGKLTVDIDGGHDIAHAVALQSDGSIVVSGAISLGSDPVFIEHTGLTRLTSSGEVDTNFGSGGTVILEDEQASFAMTLQSEDKIIVVGMTDGNGFSNDDFIVMRLTANGTPDDSFGNAGKTTTDFGPFQDTAQAVTVQTDGKIVVAGFTLFESPAAGGGDFALARYITDGTPDPEFGDGGKLTIDFFGAGDGAEGVAVQTDGKIIVGGTVTNGPNLELGLARVTP
jgi:uncharacterized delta-60 repeat protein